MTFFKVVNPTLVSALYRYIYEVCKVVSQSHRYYQSNKICMKLGFVNFGSKHHALGRAKTISETTETTSIYLNNVSLLIHSTNAIYEYHSQKPFAT